MGLLSYSLMALLRFLSSKIRLAPTRAVGGREIGYKRTPPILRDRSGGEAMGRLMAQVQHPPGPPMTLGNMRELQRERTERWD